MSYRALVIPEDPTYNGALLKPLVTRMLEECGRPNAQVTVLTNPRLGGIEQLKQSMPLIAERYAHFDLLLCLVDADGKDRSAMLAALEGVSAQAGARMLCCAAVQEIEVWLLAGFASELKVPWKDVRADISVKENVFGRFLRLRGDPRRPAGGRETLMKESLKQYSAILHRCPELAELEHRLRALLSDLR